jgi:hypothetical protein
MRHPHIVSVSWGDHLTFGEGDGRLVTEDALARRMDTWRHDLGAGTVYWRLLRTRLDGRFQAARGFRHPSTLQAQIVSWDDFQVVPRLAKSRGLRVYLYVSLFDEGWPLARPARRAVSYHNAMHWQHTAWQSRFSAEHPEFVVADRTGRRRQWGVLCLAEPLVREQFVERLLGLIEPTDFDGLFLCLRSQSKPANTADQFGFNDRVRHEFLRRYGADIRCDPFDVDTWRALRGSYLTQFLRELRSRLTPLGRCLAVGVPRGDVIGPPFGNMALEWREWVRDDLVDELIINQNSSQCPSMWHQLWPMHRGHGYTQNYLDGTGLRSLRHQLECDYAPALSDLPARLYVARQWNTRSTNDEMSLRRSPGVDGLVFSSFRHDNPGPLARNDWRA